MNMLQRPNKKEIKSRSIMIMAVALVSPSTRHNR